MENNIQYSFGWERDLPDLRDYTLDSEEVKSFIVKNIKEDLEPTGKINIEMPELREQGKLGSCTAHAGNYLYDIHQKVNKIDYEPLSRLFLYKVTRNLLGWRGDTGAYLRTAMQAIVTFGIPPERYYPYKEDVYDEEPSAFLYAMAQNYQGLTYYRLDPYGTKPEELIKRIKANIKLQRGCIFGFIVYSFDKSGNILLPSKGQKPLGGHAVTAIAWDDNRVITHSNGQTVGAFKFANWWGKSWGENGFGWIPYQYILSGFATDWWTMMTAEWLSTKQFS